MKYPMECDTTFGVDMSTMAGAIVMLVLVFGQAGLPGQDSVSSRRSHSSEQSVKFPRKEKPQESLLKKMTEDRVAKRGATGGRSAPVSRRNKINSGFRTSKDQERNLSRKNVWKQSAVAAKNRSRTPERMAKRPADASSSASNPSRQQLPARQQLSSRPKLPLIPVERGHAGDRARRNAVSVLESRQTFNESSDRKTESADEAVADIPVPQTPSSNSVLHRPELKFRPKVDRSAGTADEVRNKIGLTSDSEHPNRLLESRTEIELDEVELDVLASELSAQNKSVQEPVTELVEKPVDVRRPSEILLDLAKASSRYEKRVKKAQDERLLEIQKRENLFRSRMESIAESQRGRYVPSLNVGSENVGAGIESSSPQFAVSGLNSSSDPKIYDKDQIGVYANLTDGAARVTFGNQQESGLLGEIGDVESESIYSLRKPSKTEGKASTKDAGDGEALAPSALWMNDKSRYSWSRIKPVAQSEKRGKVDLPKSGLTATLNAIGNQDQDNLDESSLDELDQNGQSTLEFENEIQDEIQEAAAKDSSDGEVAILRNRERYRSELYRPLTDQPVARALLYLDDKEQVVPATENQRLHLIGFNGFYNNAIMLDRFRTTHAGHLFSDKFAVWQSPDLCYQPLYYEDANLERFGAGRKYLQPAASAIHFFASTVTLPYKTALDPYWECQYAAGFGRPGNSYCYQRERLVWDFKAGSLQSLLALGIVFAIP